ncbi:MAG: GNAT family N-acetyltransferase [Clostridia bacterium]|nr:GNAT family N-acetyltransferase [Clostridia bacterium]
MKKKLFSEIPQIESRRLLLRQIAQSDSDSLEKLARSGIVYRFLPTFLYEQKYPDIRRVIDGLYTECFRDSIILGVFESDRFCGLAEMYGLRDEIHKVSIGYRFLQECWGRGIATETVRLLVDYLLSQTDIEIITASTMVENRASAKVLMNNGFQLVNSNVGEDWGYGRPTPADKWFL